MNFNNLKISAQLVIIMLSLGLLVALVIGGWSAWSSYQALDASIQQHFEAMRDVRSNQISTWFDDTIKTADAIGGTSDVEEMTANLVDYHIKMEVQPTEPFPVTTTEYGELWEDGYRLEKLLDDFGYYDVFVVCKAHGHVMYSVTKKSDLGQNVGVGRLKDSGLGQCWKGVVDTGKPFITDWEPYEPAGGEPAQFIGTPIKIDGEFKHVFIVQVPLDQLDGVMQDDAGMGETGETYLVGQNHSIHNNSRLSDTDTMLTLKVDTDQVNAALSGDSGYMQSTDYDGNPCLSAYAPFEVGGMTWAVIAEIDKSEAYAPIVKMIWAIVIAVLLLAALVAAVAVFTGRKIGLPLGNLAGIADKVADGDLTVQITTSTAKDEIGMLTRSLTAMLQNTHQVVSQVAQAATSIASSSEELSAGADETSKVVQEVAKTIDEVAKGAQSTTTSVSEAQHNLDQNSKALEGISRDIEEVAAYATQAAAQGEEGRTAANNAAAIIGRAATSVDETTVVVKSLGEKTDQIGEFIGIITGIADQTNLLALNAAIEAARAGEAGRGFAVVAEEVRKLAEESNQAAGNITGLVKAISDEMQIALVAMDKSNEEVNQGSATVNQASTMLGEIVGGVLALNEKVQNISAASEQINASTGEIVGVMGSVVTVAEENAAASEQVSSSTEEQSAAMEEINAGANTLAGLAQELQATISRFTV